MDMIKVMRERHSVRQYTEQKFNITQQGEQASIRVKGIGTLTRLDLGIVKYHFETASGHKAV